MRDLIDTARAVSAEASTRIGHRPLQPRAIRTKDGIVETAATHFNSFGYSASKTGDILAQAGSTKGAMYFRFSAFRRRRDWRSIWCRCFQLERSCCGLLYFEDSGNFGCQ